MHRPIYVTFTVELNLPLGLLQDLKAEAVRRDISIDAMLSMHLVEAAEEREAVEMENQAQNRITTLDTNDFMEKVNTLRSDDDIPFGIPPTGMPPTP